MGRIGECFARLKARGETGLVAYLTVGFPNIEATLQLVAALAEGGADMVELGIPFSDPLADGATVQRASHHALQLGVTPRRCLEVTSELRRRGLDLPILLMGYYNPLLSFGIGAFADAAAAAGVDGLIVPDLPPEEGEELRVACRERGLDLVFLVAPTSSDERVALVAQKTAGFIYCVSLAGVTGARETLPEGLGAFLARVRRSALGRPLAVGFGIATAAHFAAVGRMAEAAVVGSALLDVVQQAPPAEAAERLREFVARLKGARHV